MAAPNKPLSGVLVELRKDGQPHVTVSIDTYLRFPLDLATEGTAHLILQCDGCKLVHELGTFEEVIGALMGPQPVGGCLGRVQ